MYKKITLMLCASLAVLTLLTGCDSEDTVESSNGVSKRRAEGVLEEETGNTPTRLYSTATYQIATGFAYDATRPMGQGTTYQIFNINGMDRAQIRMQRNYVWDDFDMASTQEVVTAYTRDDLNTKLQLQGSGSLALYGVKVTLSGSYSSTDIESRTHLYGMMRLNNTCFSRDLQYSNILADCETYPDLDLEVFTPVFASDRRTLLAYNDNPDRDIHSFRNDIHNFLVRWGVSFVCHSAMGCSLDYVMTIDKKVISNTITIDAAIKAATEVTLIEADGTVNYKETMEKIKGSFEYQLEARGGDVSLLSVINSGDKISPEVYRKWCSSICFGKGPLKDNCVLASVRLASIAQLFSGDVATEMQRQIDDWPVWDE